MDPAGPHDDWLVRSPVPLPGFEAAEAGEAKGPEEGKSKEEAALALGPGPVKQEADEETGDQSQPSPCHLPHSTDRSEMRDESITAKTCDGGVKLGCVLCAR